MSTLGCWQVFHRERREVRAQGEVWSTLALAPSQVPHSTSLGKEKDEVEGQEGLGEILPMEKQRDGVWCWPLALLSPLTDYPSTNGGRESGVSPVSPWPSQPTGSSS